MPFETIHFGSNAGADIATQQYGVGATTPQVSIHWTKGREGVVQFGFTVDFAVLDEMARMRLAGHFGNDDVHTFYTAPVSRDELNRGIRAMRSARDAEFGKDE